jgi:hypothetical protein
VDGCRMVPRGGELILKRKRVFIEYQFYVYLMIHYLNHESWILILQYYGCRDYVYVPVKFITAWGMGYSH